LQKECKTWTDRPWNKASFVGSRERQLDACFDLPKDVVFQIERNATESRVLGIKKRAKIFSTLNPWLPASVFRRAGNFTE